MYLNNIVEKEDTVEEVFINNSRCIWIRRYLTDIDLLEGLLITVDVFEYFCVIKNVIYFLCLLITVDVFEFKIIVCVWISFNVY